jgi:hypothetical protein
MLEYVQKKNAEGNSVIFQDPSDNVWKLRGDRLIQEASKHFGCLPTLDGTETEEQKLIKTIQHIGGLPLENGGGSGSAGSHFEKLVFADETMVSDDTVDAKLTVMTLAVAEDTGWYIPNYGVAADYFWGKGEGCGLIKKSCTQHTDIDEFCEAPSPQYHRGCSDNGLYVTTCHTSSFAGGAGECPINLQIKRCNRKMGNDESTYSNEYFHTQSLCFKGIMNDNINLGLCQRVKCNADKTSYEIMTNPSQAITDGSNVCPPSTPSGDDKYDLILNNMKYKCKPVSEVCGRHTECPYDCHFRGYCTQSKKCSCDPLYSGEACGTYSCPSLIPESLCDIVTAANGYTKFNLSNNDVTNTDGGTTGGDTTNGGTTGGDTTNGGTTGGDTTGGDTTGGDTTGGDTTGGDTTGGDTTGGDTTGGDTTGGDTTGGDTTGGDTTGGDTTGGDTTGGDTTGGDTGSTDIIPDTTTYIDDLFGVCFAENQTALRAYTQKILSRRSHVKEASS